jgi:hypothetical protein
MHKVITIQIVHGGFIVTTQVERGYNTEVFTSQGKLLKAIRTMIEDQSLVSKKESPEEENAGSSVDDAAWPLPTRKNPGLLNPDDESYRS